MITIIIAHTYQVGFLLISTISAVGASLVIYVTIRSKSLRSPCNIMIAMASFGDILQSISGYVLVGAHALGNDHQIRLDVCSYLQLAPLFGFCLSIMLLLSIAADRLMSFMKFYKILIHCHMKMYMVAQILPACIFGIIVDAYVLLRRKSYEEVVCFMTTPLKDESYEVFLVSVAIICILVILCYVLFIFFLKRVQIGSGSVKSIYRSLLVITLTVVLGYLSAAVVLSICDALRLNINKLHVNLSSGIIQSVATAANFFVYYIVSKEYRRVFDEFLGIGRLKQFIHLRKVGSTVQPTAFRSTNTNPR